MNVKFFFAGDATWTAPSKTNDTDGFPIIQPLPSSNPLR